MSGCPFCDRITNREVDDLWQDVASFEPLNPVVPGHKLFVPVEHTQSALDKPWIAGHVQYIAGLTLGTALPGNFIWNVGEDAGQTVFHAHLHWVPRLPGDGLAMPWTAQQALATVGGAA